MAGYSRRDSDNQIANGKVIDADIFDAEYDAIAAAFNSVSGHTHDGTEDDGGAPITKVGPSLEIQVNGTQVLPTNGSGVMDLGSDAAQFKNLWLSETLNLPDNGVLNLGTNDDLKIYHDGLNSYIEDADTGSLVLKTNTGVVVVDSNDLQLANFSTNGSTYLNHVTGGIATNRLQTTSTGITVNGNVRVPNGGAGSNRTIMFDGTYGMSFDYDARGTDGLQIKSSPYPMSFIANGDPIRWSVDANATRAMVLTGSGNLGINTESPDRSLQVYGTGSNAIISVKTSQGGLSSFNGASAGLQLIAGSMNTSTKYTPAVQFGTYDSAFTSPKMNAGIVGRATETYEAATDGGMALDFFVTADNAGSGQQAAHKVTIHSSGVGINTTAPSEALDVVGNAEVSGTITFAGGTSSGTFVMNDDVPIEFGNNNGLRMYHNGATGYIENQAGFFYLRNNDTDKDIILQSDNGSGGYTDYLRADGDIGELKLYHYGNQKLATKSTGVDVTGTLTSDGLTVDGDVNIESPSGYGRLEMGGPYGAYIDLKSPFSDSYDGRIIYGSGALSIETLGNEPIRLKHQGTTRLSTSSTGVAVTGTLTATEFYAAKNSGIPTSSPTTKFGRSDTQFVTFHGDNGSNYISSVSPYSNPKELIKFGISVDGGASLTSVYTLNGSSGTIWHTGNDSTLFKTTGGGLTGQLDMNNNNIVGVNAVVHEADSNTYMHFPAADQYEVVVGGNERLTVTSNGITVAGNIVVSGTVDGVDIANHNHDSRYLRKDTSDTSAYNLTVGKLITDEVQANSSQNGGDLLFKSQSGNAIQYYDDSAARWYWKIEIDPVQGTYAERLRLTDTGLGVKNINPSVALDVNGSIEYNGTISQVSDDRLKTNKVQITGALDKIAALTGYTYNRFYEDAEQTEMGIIAQDVQAVLPVAVTPISVDTDGDGTTEEYLGVSYIQLIAPMVEAIKELKTRVEELEAQLNA